MWLCSQCGKPFNSCLKLLQHRRVHSVFRPFICYVGQCTKLFSNVSAYQCHRRRHVDHRLYGCSKCRLKFLSLIHRKQHKCGAKVKTCNTCHQRFHHVLPLKYHIKLEHPSAQRIDSYKCEQSSVGQKNKYIKSISSLDSVGQRNKNTKPADGCDKDGNKILLKITAGKSTTIISPKRELKKKHFEEHQKKKSKKKQKRTEKEKKNGIILSIKNIPKLKKAYICKRVNGLPVEKEPVKQVGDLKLKIKTYPSLTVEQNSVKNNQKTFSDEGSSESSPKAISATRVYSHSEKLYAEGERTPNRKVLSDTLSPSPSSCPGESKVRNGIVIVKDKSGRFQAEQLQSAKMRKRDRDNVFDSFGDIGVWKVMPSPRTDNPTDILKLRLSPQKPLRLDSGLDQTFESAAARYLDVSVKTKAVYNSGDDSDLFEPGMVLDKDSENGGQGVNDSGIEVLSSSTIRSNGNSVHSGILDESSPNYLNTEDSLLSIDSPVTEALSKSEHTLCHKCGGIIIETNNNAYSPRRCRCYLSNPNSPFQTPMSPMKNSIQLLESNEKSYSENKKKASPEIQRGNSEDDKCFYSNMVGQKLDIPDYKLDALNESETSSVRTAETEMCKSPSKRLSDSKAEGKSLCLKIQLGENPSVERLSERRSPRKNSPDKQLRQKSPDKSKSKKVEKQRPNKHKENLSTVESSEQSLKDKDLSSAGSGLNVSPVISVESDNEELESTQDLSMLESKDLFSLSKNVQDVSTEELKSVVLSKPEKNEQESSYEIPKIEMKSTVKGYSENSSIETSSDKDQRAEIINSVEKTIYSQEIISKPESNILPQEKKDDAQSIQEKEFSDVTVKTTKKKPLFKKQKVSKDIEREGSVSTQTETPSTMTDDTKSKSKKPLFKKRTHSVDTEENPKKNKKPIFKRTVSAIETEQKHRNTADSTNVDKTIIKRAENVETKLKKVDENEQKAADTDENVYKDFTSNDLSEYENSKNNERKQNNEDVLSPCNKVEGISENMIVENDLKNKIVKEYSVSGNVEALPEDNKTVESGMEKQTNQGCPKLSSVDVLSEYKGTVEEDVITNISNDCQMPSTGKIENILPEINENINDNVKAIIASPTTGGIYLMTEKEDSLQEVPTVIDGDDLPLSPNSATKVTSPLNPFQQQFLSFLSTARIPNKSLSSKKENTSKKAKKKTTETIEKDNKEKENICEKKEDIVEQKSQRKDKEKRKKKQVKKEENQNKSDTNSWLNIFSQMNSEKNETSSDKAGENKDDTADFKADLDVINQKMGTQKDDDSDSLDVDDIFESKNLSNLQPLQNPKEILHPESKMNCKERKKSARKRKRHPTHLDSDFSVISSEEETIDMLCCHKKHDPNFNPFMESDDDFMPSKPFKRRESTSRRGKKYRSSRSMSSECDPKFPHGGKAEDRMETGSTTSRSKRSKQGQKSSCPCCLGSFGDIGDSDDEYCARQPSYKLPRNHKQFVKSTLRLMQLQEKIHRLFINLFPNCVDLISKTKTGTEEFEVLIEDVLYGLGSNDVQFEPSCASSLSSTSDHPILSPQGLPCQVQATETLQPTLTHATAVSENIIPNSVHSIMEQNSIIFPSHGDKMIPDHPNIIQNDLCNPGFDDILSDQVTTGNNTSTSSRTLEPNSSDKNHTINSSEPDDLHKVIIISDSISAETLKPSETIDQVNSQVTANSIPLVSDQLMFPHNPGMADPGVRLDHNVNNDNGCGYVEDNSYMDCDSSVQSHLEITIDLSAARVSVCREPKHCLQRLQGQLVKLVKYLMPELDLKNYFYRNVDNLEFLIDLMTVANSQENKHVVHENDLVLSSDSEPELTKVKPNSASDMTSGDNVDELEFDKQINISTDKSSVLSSISKEDKDETSNTKKEGIPFEMLIKSQRESLKKDVFQFEEVDTAAMIKSSESVLSNIETLSKIAKCTARTKRAKSRESRLRKRTAEEKRTLFVQEKVLNSQNSTIVCHSKKVTEISSRSENKLKHSENPKQRFLSELNLGDRQDKVQNNTEQIEEEKGKSTEENLQTGKQEIEELDSDSKRKSSDKNIFELMQPSQSVENASS